MDGCWHRKLQIAEYSDEDIFYSVWINFTRLLLLLKKREKKWGGIETSFIRPSFIIHPIFHPIVGNVLQFCM